MRTMTPVLAQRILYLAESQHLDDAKIGQRLGLPIHTVQKILRNRAGSTIHVPVTTRIKVTTIRQEMHEGNGLGHFPRTESRRKRRRIE
jgi:hypothetical protein